MRFAGKTAGFVNSSRSGVHFIAKFFDKLEQRYKRISDVFDKVKFWKYVMFADNKLCFEIKTEMR